MAEAEAEGGIGGNAAGFTVNEPGESSRQSGADSDQTGAIRFTVSETEPQAHATVSVEQPLPKGTRRCSVCGLPGHTARTCPNAGSTDVGTRAASRPTKAAVGMLAPMVVGTLNFCVVTTFGSECGITDLEQKLAIPSMQRILERMPAEAATKAAIIIDPVVLVTVMIMWGRRIQQIKQREAELKYAVAPTEAARAAGFSGYTQDVTNGKVEVHVPAEPDPNSTTGSAVPPEIRQGFDSNF